MAVPDRASNGPLIKLVDIRRTFHLGEIDLKVLRGITLAIEPGELVALTGPSGSGKSTLMNILGCLDRPTSGEYWLDGEETARLSGDKRALIRNRKIGFIFQSFNLLPRTTAVEQVMMPLAYTAGSLADREAKERAIAILEKVGLGDRLDHRPGQLSGGQQQRIAIARALVNHPPLLLADEPTGNLDSKTTLEILAMLQTLNRDEGITIVIVTHDPMVAGYAGRVVHMTDGAIESDAAATAAPSAGAHA
jgi:ABC-type lipoprotein export system ATPase subunit